MGYRNKTRIQVNIRDTNKETELKVEQGNNQVHQIMRLFFSFHTYTLLNILTNACSSGFQHLISATVHTLEELINNGF